MLTLGQKIRLRRRERGLTQTALSEMCRIPQSNLSKIEKDICDIHVSTLQRVAKALEIHPSQLIDGNAFEIEAGKFLTRERIERIAEAVINGNVPVSIDEAKVVALFRNILPEKTSRYVSLNKLYDSWLSLRDLFSQKEIKSIYDRIHNASARSHET